MRCPNCLTVFVAALGLAAPLGLAAAPALYHPPRAAASASRLRVARLEAQIYRLRAQIRALRAQDARTRPERRARAYKERLARAQLRQAAQQAALERQIAEVEQARQDAQTALPPPPARITFL